MSTPCQSRYAWDIAPQDRVRTAELARDLGVSRIVAHLLLLRDVSDADAGHRFLTPSLDQLTDPFVLTGMQAAVDRIHAARQDGEAVQVFGDYDVDGIAGTAILLEALQRFGIRHVSYGMPSRITEGYGLGTDHVEAARQANTGLIITVDNGINARDAASLAQALGIDLVVTDHHQLEGALPHAAAIINPKQEAAPYPGRDLAGAGVAFKLAWALTGSVEDLDLAALGTIADIVPLRRENRVLAALGLEEMRRQPRIGLRALASVAGIDIGKLVAENVAFQIGPRLNAAGRLGDGIASLELLLTESYADAVRMASDLNKANQERRAIEKRIFDQAVEMLESAGEPPGRSIVLAHREWHPGVIGIVASRLLGLYNRPVVLVAIDDEGVGRGSARSAEAFDMAGALAGCKDALLRFGGHAAAGGLAVQAERLAEFAERFEDEARMRLPAEEAPATLPIDALVAFSEVDAQLVKALDRLEPYGCMNPHPLFCTCGVTPVAGSFRELTGGHIKCVVRQDNRQFNVIGFRMAEAFRGYANAPSWDIAYTPRWDAWRGNASIQLVLKDIRIP